MPITLDQLNSASLDDACALLDGLYEHSPWIARAALAQRPFMSLAQLKHAMAKVVSEGGADAQLALLRAHPELAGKAMVDKSLTAESTNEQNKAGLTQCTPAEFEKSRNSMPTTTHALAFRSFWRCVVRVAWALPRPKSLPPLSAD